MLPHTLVLVDHDLDDSNPAVLPRSSDGVAPLDLLDIWCGTTLLTFTAQLLVSASAPSYERSLIAEPWSPGSGAVWSSVLSPLASGGG